MTEQMDQIDMLEVRLVANRLAGGKAHHLSGHVVLEAVNEILRQRAELKALQTAVSKVSA
jgi:hypothetical protein